MQLNMNSMNREEVAKKMNATNKNENTMAEPEDIKLGSKVYHPKFGVGTVVTMAGSDVTIAFEYQGIKKINKEYTTVDLLKE